jgi:hypothetical protein
MIKALELTEDPVYKMQADDLRSLIRPVGHGLPITRNTRRYAYSILYQHFQVNPSPSPYMKQLLSHNLEPPVFHMLREAYNEQMERNHANIEFSSYQLGDLRARDLRAVPSSVPRLVNQTFRYVAEFLPDRTTQHSNTSPAALQVYNQQAITVVGMMKYQMRNTLSFEEGQSLTKLQHCFQEQMSSLVQETSRAVLMDELTQVDFRSPLESSVAVFPRTHVCDTIDIKIEWVSQAFREASQYIGTDTEYRLGITGAENAFAHLMYHTFGHPSTLKKPIHDLIVATQREESTTEGDQLNRVNQYLTFMVHAIRSCSTSFNTKAPQTLCSLDRLGPPMYLLLVTLQPYLSSRASSSSDSLLQTIPLYTQQQEQQQQQQPQTSQRWAVADPEPNAMGNQAQLLSNISVDQYQRGEEFSLPQFSSPPPMQTKHPENENGVEEQGQGRHKEENMSMGTVVWFALYVFLFGMIAMFYDSVSAMSRRFLRGGVQYEDMDAQEDDVDHTTNEPKLEMEFPMNLSQLKEMLLYCAQTGCMGPYSSRDAIDNLSEQDLHRIWNVLDRYRQMHT